MTSREAHVVPGSSGDWEVVVAGSGVVTSRHRTQREATVNAKQLLEQRGGGEAVIHGRQGEIQGSDRVGPRSGPGSTQSS